LVSAQNENSSIQLLEHLQNCETFKNEKKSCVFWDISNKSKQLKEGPNFLMSVLSLAMLFILNMGFKLAIMIVLKIQATVVIGNYTIHNTANELLKANQLRNLRL